MKKKVLLSLGTFLFLGMMFTMATGPLDTLFSIFNQEENRGIAILPFRFAGASPDDQALANGLSYFTADMVSRYEDSTDKFWLVPPGVTQKEKIKDGLEAKRIMGIGHTVSGSGRIKDDWVSLRITINDSWGGGQVTYILEDDLANLKTWQVDLPLLILTNLDGTLDSEAPSKLPESMTNVPASFRSYLTGLGYAYDSTTDPDYKKAATFFNTSVAQDSSFACSWSGLGYATWRESKGHDAEGLVLAESYLRMASSLDLTHPGPRIHLAAILAKRGETDEARMYYRQALSLNGTSEGALKGLWNLERYAGNTEKAEEYLNVALQARPDYFGTLYDFGVYSYYHGELDQAESFFRHLVTLAPQQQQGYNLLGATFFEMDKYTDSEKMFESSLAIEPSYMAYSNLGTLYFYSGRLLDSAEMARKALALDDTRYSAWRTLAEANYWTPGLRDSSRAAYYKCAEIITAHLAKSKVDGSAGDAELRSDLATVQVRLGKFDEAGSLLAALEQEKHLEAPTMFNLASAYEQMQDRDNALLWLEKAVAADLSLSQIERYPGLRNLRTHPRFLALRKKYGAN